MRVDRDRLEALGLDPVLHQITVDPLYLHHRMKHVSVSTRDEKRMEIRTAADLLAHKMRTSVMVGMTNYSIQFVPEASPQVQKSMRTIIAVQVSRAPAYFWKGAVMARIQEDAKRIPDVSLSPEMVGEPSMWWCLEDDIRLGDKQHDLDSILLVRHEFGLSVTQITMPTRPVDGEWPHEAMLVTILMRWGDKLGRIAKRVAERGLGESALDAMLLIMLTFLNSHYIPKERKYVKRSEIKGKKKLYKPATWVDLRSIETIPGVTHDESGAQKKDFDHRWLVRGHVRQQWYPSSQEHQAIFVPPHVKGPEGRPLIIKPKRVIR